MENPAVAPPLTSPGDGLIVDAFEGIADVLPSIISQLGPRDLCQLARTSHYMAQMAEDSELWRVLVAAEAKFFVVARALVDENKWKEIFKRKQQTSMEEYLSQPRPDEALLVPSGKYLCNIDVLKDSQMTIIGLENGKGEVIFYTDVAHRNLVEVTSGSLTLRNVTLRLPESITPLTIWSVAILVKNARVDVENCRFEGHAEQWALAGLDGTTIFAKRCVSRGFGAVFGCWSGTKLEAEDCYITAACAFELRKSSAVLKRCTMTMNALCDDNMFSNVDRGSQLVLEDCRLTCQMREYCTGILGLGNVTLARCTFDGFYYTAGKRVEANATITDCKFRSSPRGGNAYVVQGEGNVKFVNCDFSGGFTSAVELESDARLELVNCRFTKVQCAVGAYEKGTAVLSDCVFWECHTGLRVGAGAIAMPKGCTFVRCTRGLHITGLIAELRNESEALVRANTFEQCQEKLVVEAMESESADGVVPEVKRALAEQVCTFQFTGPHYRMQLMWECKTCRLVDNSCICVVCRDLCHAGHELIQTNEKPSRSYCDCGAEKFCDTLRKNAKKP